MAPKTKEPKEHAPSKETPIPEETEIEMGDDFEDGDDAQDDPFEVPDEDSDGEIDGIEGFGGGCDAASYGDFDPIQALGQLLVTHDGETVPDVLVGIKQSLDTLTKVLHKIGKTLEKK